MKRVLVIATGGLGNAVLATPAVALLKRAGLQVDVLASVKRFTHVVFMGWDEVVSSIYKVESSYPVNYDYVFWTHPNWGPHKVHVKGESLELDFPTDVKGLEYRWKFKIHESEMLANLVRNKFNLKDRTPPGRVYVSKNSMKLEMSNPVAISMGYVKGNDKKWLVKHWGTDNYIELCEMLKESGFTPLLVGSKGDYNVDGKPLIQACPFVVNLCGTLPLETVLAILGQCVGYIGNDSGLMHCASVQDIFTLGLFFHDGSSPIKNYPLGKRGNWLWRKRKNLSPKEVFDIWCAIHDDGERFKEMKVCG